MHIKLYTDGSSRGNPGPGGYGAILMTDQNHYKEIYGGYRLTTNNRMELLAVIEGLKAVKNKSLPITVYSDSKYVVDAISKGWLAKWINTQFAGGKKNKDLWLAYHELSLKLKINFVWVKGHAENHYNNRCDELATTAAVGKNLLIDNGYEEGLK